MQPRVAQKHTGSGAPWLITEHPAFHRLRNISSVQDCMLFTAQGTQMEWAKRPHRTRLCQIVTVLKSSGPWTPPLHLLQREVPPEFSIVKVIFSYSVAKTKVPSWFFCSFIPHSPASHPGADSSSSCWLSFIEGWWVIIALRTLPWPPF